MDQNQTGGEWARMVSGRLYDPANQEIAKRHRTGLLRCDRFNRIALWRAKAKQRALERLIPSAKGKNFEVFAPFYCEYGVNIHVGQNCFVNYKSVFLDVAPITLGNNVLVGPNVTLATPNHPFLAEERAFADYPDGCHELEYAQPINHRRPLLAVLRRDGLRRRDHRSRQYHCRRRGGDPRHPTPQHCRRRTRPGAAADQRERPHTCVGEIYKKRASTLIFMQTKSI